MLVETFLDQLDRLRYHWQVQSQQDTLNPYTGGPVKLVGVGASTLNTFPAPDAATSSGNFLGGPTPRSALGLWSRNAEGK